ncbi:MAG TPA: hypothetical protein VIZ68_05285 [Thermoplasmata archaeon]
MGIALAVIIGLGTGFGLAHSGGTGTPAPTTGASTPAGAASVSLVIAWNPESGLDEVFPANFQVPSSTPVTVTIISYDDGSNLVSSSYTGVQGTQGGTETITTDGVARVVSGLPSTGISHTFTLMSMGMMSMGSGMGPGGMLNVVIPPAPSISDPVTVTFTVVFGTAGTYTWMCLAPCDPESMTTPGLMTGAITVT